MLLSAPQSSVAVWLNTYLAGFDHFFLSIQYFFGEHAGGFLTPVMKTITFLGEKGWPFFLLALICMLMADKRDLGVCIFGAVCCGALITNIILKDNVARLRPFQNSIEYELWWNAVGSPAEDGFSFPSGHVTACAAAMTAITLMRGKKWIIPSVITIVVMSISRNYLMAHYPSDVIAAAFIGIFSGVVAWFITQLIFRLLNHQRGKIPFFAFVLDFDIRDIIPLPAFPSRKSSKGKASASQLHRPRAVPDGDDDVKTYSAKAGASSGRASGPSGSAVRSGTPASVHTKEASQYGGRHVLPSSSGSSKNGSRKSSGSYQGKH